MKGNALIMNQITFDSQTYKLRVLHRSDNDQESKTRNQIVKILNDTLANEALLAQKTRNAHWKIRGAGFSYFQILLEVQMKQLNEISHQVAVRVNRLSNLPASSFEELQKLAQSKEVSGIVPLILDLKADHESMIQFLREDATKCSEELDDEISRGFLVDIIHLHENMAAMLQFYVENESSGNNSSKGDERNE